MISQFVDSLRKGNRLLVGGMFFFDSPGHMLSETDYLLRLIRHDPAIKARSPVVLMPSSPMTLVIAEVLKANGVNVVIDQNAPGILREIQLFHPDLILDVGMAHWKLVVADKTNRGLGNLYPLQFGWALRRDEFITQTVKLHESWNATRGQLPLREGLARIPIDPEFTALLSDRKYVVLQIKARVGNGTAKLLTGDAYVPTLEMLKDQGYTIILGGREPMLDEFKRFGTYDYPRSKFVCPKNDFFLFSKAALGIVSPSGAGLFCDTLGIPCCQVGSWTLIPHPSEKTLMVPSRLKELKTANLLTFSQQAISLRTTYDEVLGPACFDPKLFENIPPAADEIAGGVREVLGRDPTAAAAAPAHADAIKRLDPLGMWKAAASRMSSTFLERHPEFLN
jgi:putative glycosyltransferase (TIGR04372 family)